MLHQLGVGTAETTASVTDPLRSCGSRFQPPTLCWGSLPWALLPSGRDGPSLKGSEIIKKTRNRGCYLLCGWNKVRAMRCSDPIIFLLFYFVFSSSFLLKEKKILFVNLSPPRPPPASPNLAFDRMLTRNQSPFWLSLKGSCLQSSGVT